MWPSLSRLNLLSTNPAPGQGNQDPGALFRESLPYLLILAAIVLVAWVVLVIIKRSTRSSGSPMEQGFTLGEIRRLHAEGELSDEEFEQARGVILGQFAPGESDTGEQTPPGGSSEPD